MKLLIVDDNALNLKLLGAQLQDLGHTVVTAANGVEALQVLEHDTVDGIISDVLMPRMDGYRLCQEIRKSERWRRLPFIFYAATYNSPTDRRLAESLGANGYFAKPSPTQSLVEALQAAARSETRVEPFEAVEPPRMELYNDSLIRELQEKSIDLVRVNGELIQMEARLSGLVESALDAIIAIDEAHRIVLFNAAAGQMFCCSCEQAINRPLGDFIPERFREAHHAQIEAFSGVGATKRSMSPRTVFGLRSDGSEFPIEASISKVDTSDGKLFTVFIRDITERLRSEARILNLNRVYAMLSAINALIVRVSDREELFREACRIAVVAGNFSRAWIAVVDDPPDAIRFAAWHGAADQHFEALQARVEADTRAGRGILAQAIDQRLPVIVDSTRPEAQGRIGGGMLDSDSRSAAAFPLLVDDKVYGVLVLHSPEPGVFDGEEMKLLGELAGDVSFALDHLSRIQRIEHLANFDGLTGLPNRTLFTERLAHRLDEIGQTGGKLAVIIMDLERFRQVNEGFGRKGGDQLLKLVAERLYQESTSVARIGVDLFAFMVGDASSVNEIARFLEHAAARCFDVPFVLQDQELRVGCRSGVAVFPDDGGDAETLLRNAEAAWRRARTASEHCVFYAADMNAQAAAAMNLESRLRRAIEHQEFVLHYQPKVYLSDARICGVEALIRWQDPQQGLVPPMRFISVLEESGLIGTVGRWALGQAMADHRRWRDAGLDAPRVAVNVSPLQLKAPDFAAQIRALAEAEGSAALELEITESVVMENVQKNVAMLREIRGYGVGIAIDDFGTGYSSLAYIAKLPITSLKIDRAFVTGMTDSPEGMSLVSSIIALAHALRFKVVAEGVETEQQAQLLRLLSCDEAQGFLFSRPVPSAEIEVLLRYGGPLPLLKSAA